MPLAPGERAGETDGELGSERSSESRLDAPTQEIKSFARTPRPLILQRYILLGQLGSGGTSMVYKAYDPELDRKVALKLLQTRSDDSLGRGRTRLLREAQAMARLTHPNVVTVHDVSVYGELDLGLESNELADALEIPTHGVFIVMELVEGGDLRRWLNRRHRPWRSVLDVMLAAGRGLAAAHEVGIVHRDFKPGNLLIGDDSRVLVSDFGLARAVTSSSASASASASVASASESMSASLSWDDADSHLTREGTVLGTPPYMSPEQHRGDGSDPRSDQFGFGVTLYEALFGVRPFAGSTKEMRRAKDRRKWRSIPAGTDVPTRVIHVLERTLQPDPEDRYPGMLELLEALDRARRPRVSLPVIGSVGAVAVAVGVAFSMRSGPEEDPCGAGAERLAEVWNPDRREQVQAAFAASTALYARSAARRVEVEIDEWTGGWNQAYREACEATHVRREQSIKALDLRVSCLNRHLRELDAMVDLMVERDEKVIENAVVSAQSLGEVETCTDVAALVARMEPPGSTEARARVDAGYGRLAESRAHILAGRYEQAVELSHEVADEAAAVEYLPLEAAAEHRMAQALQFMGDFRAAEDHLFSAILAAERSRDETTAADAWIDLVWVVGVEQVRPEQALQWIRFAEAALDRLGADEVRRAALDHNRGGVYYRLGRYGEALIHYERAYETQREHYGQQHPLVAQTLNHIGNVLIMQGRYDEARVKCEQALSIRRETLGSTHPRVAAPLNNLAELVSRQGDREQALRYAEQALAITRGSGRPEELFAWILVARQHENLGHSTEELAARRRLLELLAAHPGFDQSSREEHEERINALEQQGSAPARAARAAPEDSSHRP
ncbi:MAG: serine/threonine-protein kinase [Myxococcota bacterium]